MIKYKNNRTHRQTIKAAAIRDIPMAAAFCVLPETVRVLNGYS